MKKLIALLLCAALMLSMTACAGGTAETTQPTVPPTTTEPAPDPAEVYNTAADQIRAADEILITYTIEKKISLGADTYLETEQVALSQSQPGTEDFVASAVRKFSWGEAYSGEFKESFSGGAFYTSFDGQNLTAAMTSEEYEARFLPAVLLTTELYESVVLAEDGTVTFSGATAPEAWLNIPNSLLVEASGTAVINAAGIPEDCTYHIIYTQGGVTTELNVTYRALIGPVDAAIPSDTDRYTTVDNPDSLLTYERVIGLVLQAKDVCSTLTESIVIEAGAASLTNQMDLYGYGSGKDLKAQFDSEVLLMDLSTGKPAYSVVQQEIFQNSTYTVSTDGGVPQVNRTINAELVEMSIQSHLSKNLPLESALSELTLSDMGAVSVLEFTYTEEVAKQFTTTLCGAVYEDSNLLNDLATDYRTEAAGGYIGIDNATGLPTGLGIRYAGIHTIEETECYLIYEVSQSFSFGTGEAYETVTGESLPAEEPETLATPLLYHVTGEEGQEMWLFGTIHVGDARTAHLPQELLDAFAASDALAVEFDPDDFEEQLENSSALASLVQGYYFYTDGIAATDHISDAGLYNEAIQLLKATGNYHSNLELMKPSVLANTIENAYMSLMRTLSAGQGADTQLLNLADEQEKKVRNVESGESQLRMLSGYSDALQEKLLLDAVSTDGYAYQANLLELYEMWCRGDEAELTAYLNAQEDLSELTENELALYEEYWAAMSTERNAAMLDVAKTCLTGGEVVFFAVGLAHLLAEDGLVNTLREAGYTVEPVVYN